MLIGTVFGKLALSCRGIIFKSSVLYTGPSSFKIHVEQFYDRKNSSLFVAPILELLPNFNHDVLFQLGLPSTCNKWVLSLPGIVSY